MAPRVTVKKKKLSFLSPVISTRILYFQMPLLVWTAHWIVTSSLTLTFLKIKVATSLLLTAKRSSVIITADVVVKTAIWFPPIVQLVNSSISLPPSTKFHLKATLTLPFNTVKFTVRMSFVFFGVHDGGGAVHVKDPASKLNKPNDSRAELF